MGQQQLLLIILGVIIVGIAIAVGLSMFSSSSISSNKDATINDLNNLFANGYQYRIRPASMGGGGGKYTGYTLPTSLASNENGSYVVKVDDADHITFTGTSGAGYGTVAVQIGSDGRPISSTWAYTGQFQ